MKMFPKMQDHTIDRLLRAQSGGSGKELPLCRQFDADLANAYIEHSLTSAETARYEQHLAACAPCRKSIVVLTRMARPDEVVAPAATAVRQTQGAPRVRRWLGALTAPQWAMAATAVIALAIALPLVLSHRSPQNEDALAVNESAPSARAADSTAIEPGQAFAADQASANSADAPAAAREPNAKARVAASADENPEAVAEDRKTALAGSSAGVDSSATSAASQPAAPPSTDQVIAKADSQPQTSVPAPVAQPAAGEAPPLPKIDEKEAKQLPEDKDAAKATTLKPGQSGGEERPKAEGTVQADSIAPPPPPPPSRAADSERSRRRDDTVASGPAASAFQPSREAVRGPSRRVNNHLFWLRGDVWTDKDYNPNKDMPMVTVIFDSEVYRDLLAKNAKIKPFLTGFPADARVIFIFKGTVYRLIPQGGDR
jgi:Putative zinc-finger